MDPKYQIEDTSGIYTPALIIYRELLERNLDHMIDIAGDVRRLRPHCKTHKIRQVTEIELAKGIKKHKCATLAEAEMLAQAGAADIFLAYNLVGPNIQRAIQLVQQYPHIELAVTADDPRMLQKLGSAANAAGCQIGVLLDVDTGLHRTGLPVGPEAHSLYRQIAETEGLRAGGLHVYDGHNHQQSRDERTRAVHTAWKSVIRFRDALRADQLVVPRIVAGGTGTFPIYAALDEPTLEMSPGTIVFHDAGYTEAFPDMLFEIAAVLLTRVISRPMANRVTCDLGTKACASDPPAGRRLVIPDLPDAVQVLQNEEHLVLETDRAGEFQPGDELMAIPRHICPTTALHKQVHVVAQRRVVDRWDVVARDRCLTV